MEKSITFILTPSCNNSKAESTQIAVAKFTTGDIVPNDEVCMVNNAYMGKKQLEVKHDGKTYYGCCENCKLRIPQEENARMAYDPISHQLIDKATAIIAISDKNDNVVLSRVYNKLDEPNYRSI